MAQGKRTSLHATPSAEAGSALVDKFCLLVLLAWIPLRAVIGETHTFEVPRLFRHLDVPDAAMPATTFVLFSVITAVAAIGALREWRCLVRAGSRTGIELGAAVLAAAMAISTFRAGQKHLALIGSLDFLGLLIYAMVLRRLLTRPWHVRLTLCVIVAAGAVVVAKCAYQKWIETPDTIRYFEENRAELLKAGSPEQAERQAGFLHDYEQRLRAGAVTGYFAHPNVLASYLILVIMSSLALAADRWRRVSRRAVLAPVAIAAAAAGMLVCSQSKGAGLACALALAVCTGAWAVRRWVAVHPRTAAAGVWITLLTGAALLVGVLSVRPEALGRSMLFRYFYWQGAARLVQDQGLLGIGAGNFGRLFTRYKDVACPEDVEDPHSWAVKALAEWGGIGLAGLLLVFVGVTWKLASGRTAAQAVSGSDSPPDRVRPRGAGPDPSIPYPPPGGAVILWTAALAAVVFAWWAILISGAHGGYAALVLHLPAIVWVVGFAAVSLEPGSQRRFAEGPLGPVLAPLVAGLIGFIVHAGVDLAMFNGGAATSFFALIAVCVAVRDFMPAGDRPPDQSAHARVGLSTAPPVLGVVAAIASLAIVVGLAVPAGQAGQLLRVGRTQSAAADWDGYLASPGFAAYSRAVDAYPLDATALDELLEQLERRVARVEHADFALARIDVMMRRDGQSAAAWQHKATLYYQRYVLGSDVRDLQCAVDAMQEAVAAYPTSPTRRLTLADLYEKLATTNGSGDARKAAAEQLRQALELDEARDYVSKPHRFTDETTRMIRSRIHGLQAGL